MERVLVRQREAARHTCCPFSLLGGRLPPPPTCRQSTPIFHLTPAAGDGDCDGRAPQLGNWGSDPLDIGIDIYDIGRYQELPIPIVLFNINKYLYKYLFFHIYSIF